MICQHCKKETPELDMWADEYCQDCWENYCDTTWLEEMHKLNRIYLALENK
jgi:hypothetical protein